MAILWEHEREGTQYSVRSHGESLRLYSNGVFHSQWNPNRPFAGGIWDCLSLPVLYRPVENLGEVLLLGVGGGAVIRQLVHLLPQTGVTGIEIDSVHVDIACRLFDVPAECIEHADAVSWLRSRPRDQRYDVVIDDLFGHEAGEPVRAAVLDDAWVAELGEALHDDGLLIINAIDGRELQRSVSVFTAAGFRYGRRWSLPAYDNAIGVLSREPLHSREWSRRLDDTNLPAAVKRQARACVQKGLRGLDG